jgi:CheY-like chemotaxis protein
MAENSLILLVEDNEDDALLIQRAFSKAQVLNPFIVLRRVEEAMLYLLGVGPYHNRSEFPLPALILLDLKFPGLDGFDFLRWLRQQPQINTLRVVVLSSSNSIRDIDRAYKLGANSFPVKPADFDRFVEFSIALNGYWMWMDKAPEVCQAEPVDFTTQPRLLSRAAKRLSIPWRHNIRSN